MTAADDTTERTTDESAADGGPGTVASSRLTSQPWRTPWQAIFSLLLVVVLASITFALRTDQRADDAEAELDDRREAALAASVFVETLLTYDFGELDQQQAAVAALATDRFQQEYESAFSDELAEAIQAEEASSSASVRDVFVSVDGADTVRAIVVVDSEISSRQGASAELESYLEVTMVRRGGVWLVDQLTSLGSRDAGIAGG